MNIDDQNIISASVASIISSRPKVFKTPENLYGVAVLGVLMPARIFVAAFIQELYGQCRIDDDEDPRVALDCKRFYKNVCVPVKYREGPAGQYIVSAIRDQINMLREYEDPKREIEDLIKQFEDDYAEVYEAPNYQSCNLPKDINRLYQEDGNEAPTHSFPFARPDVLSR